MEFVAFERQVGERGVGDFNSGRVVVVIEFGLDAQALVGGGSTDEIDDALADLAGPLQV